MYRKTHQKYIKQILYENFECVVLSFGPCIHTGSISLLPFGSQLSAVEVTEILLQILR